MSKKIRAHVPLYSTLDTPVNNLIVLIRCQNCGESAAALVPRSQGARMLDALTGALVATECPGIKKSENSC